MVESKGQRNYVRVNEPSCYFLLTQVSSLLMRPLKHYNEDKEKAIKFMYVYYANSNFSINFVKNANYTLVKRKKINERSYGCKSVTTEELEQVKFVIPS